MTTIRKTDGEQPSRIRLAGSISLADIWSATLASRYIILIIMIVAFVLGLFYAHFSGVTYRAQMTVVASEPATNQNLQIAIPGILGGSGQAMSRFTQFETALTGAGVAALLDQRFHFYCKLVPAQCDANGNSVPNRADDSWLRGLRLWLGSSSGAQVSPRVRTIMNYIKAKLTVEHAADSTALILSVQDKDGATAMSVLEQVFVTTNDYLRKRDQQRYSEYVAYLTGQLGRGTLNVDQRQALQNVLLEEQRNLMMTDVNTPYAASVLDPANIIPQGSVMKVFFPLLGGFILSFCVIVVRTLSRMR